jgi:hypothetical protein
MFGPKGVLPFLRGEGWLPRYASLQGQSAYTANDSDLLTTGGSVASARYLDREVPGPAHDVEICAQEAPAADHRGPEAPEPIWPRHESPDGHAERASTKNNNGTRPGRIIPKWQQTCVRRSPLNERTNVIP